MLIQRKRIPIKEILIQGFLPSFLKKSIYRIKGYKIGKGVKIGIGSIIIGKDVRLNNFSQIGHFTIIIADSIEIGRYTSIGSFTYISCVVFNIGEDSKIREQVYIGGTLNPDSELIIGNRSSVGQSCYLNPSRSIRIGDDTAIGGRSFIFTHGSWQSILDGYSVKYEPVTIEDNVYIAWNVFILPGINIGKNSTVAASSTVTINVPPHSLAAGSPLKIALSGKEKWPRSISYNTKVKIIKDINDHFIEYLIFNNIDCSLERIAEMDKLLIRNKNGIVCYYTTIENDVCFLANNTYLFLQNTETIIQTEPNIVILNIERGTRQGSNKLGEEYIKYLSRYGIRFERV
jgi:acetyltransferase-like isoleucine patch superfamily enzyme